MKVARQMTTKHLVICILTMYFNFATITNKKGFPLSIYDTIPVYTSIYTSIYILTCTVKSQLINYWENQGGGGG